jgi:ABC transporter substrate binding protein
LADQTARTAVRGARSGLAARNKLPAVYATRFSITRGGLIFYGPDLVDQFRRAADYVDRILKGEKPADLPVQAPTKYELVINVPARRNDVWSWGKTGRHMLVESLRALFGSIHRTCLSPLVTDRAMEAWYHPFVA